MRHFIILFVLLLSAISYSQNTVSVIGNITDNEVINEPLLYVNVSIKGTSIEATTDENGLFVIDNLKEGTYTLVCSFIGYETQELNVEVKSDKTVAVNLALNPTSFSFDELTSASNTAGDN
jgi:hypothetical protein